MQLFDRSRQLFRAIGPIELGCLLIITIGLLLTARLTLETRDQPWFIGVLKIDGPYYITGMNIIADTGDFLNLEEIYHSPGYQVYLGALKRIFPFDRGFFFATKLLSGILFLFTVILTIAIGERHVQKHSGWVAGAILAMSLKMEVYCNLLQGEILQAFSFTLLVFLLLTWNPSRRGKSGALLLVAVSLLAASLSFQQVRFLPLIPLSLICIFLKANRNESESASLGRAFRASMLFLAPCLLLIGFWSWHHSKAEGKPILIGTGSEFRLQVAYNPNATGASFPYPEIIEPTGMDFVVSHPTRVAWLLRERFLYLSNWKRDIWDLGNPVHLHRNLKIEPSSFEIPVHVAGTILFFLGIALRVSRKSTRRPNSSDCLLYSWIIAVTLAPMLVFASSRFLIPALPAIALFQSYAAIVLIASLQNRSN